MLKNIRRGLFALFGSVENIDVDAVVRTVYDTGGKLRMGIYHRVNGTYTFQEEVYNDKLLEMCWEPGRVGPAAGFDSPEAALEAARAALPWLKFVLE